MTVHVVVREDQNQHGFIDTEIVGVFQSRAEADRFLESRVSEARLGGVRVCGDPGAEPDWDVSWAVESHPLS